MISSFDVHNLKKLLKDFYTSVGVRISIFDEEYNPVVEYPENAPKFCTMIRNTRNGDEGCHACDRLHCTLAKTTMEPQIYTCHSGLLEVVMPLQFSGEVLGYAILAHMMPTENLQIARENAANLAQKYGIDRNEALKAVSEISSHSHEQLRSYVRILDVLASYVFMQNLVTWKNEDISKKIEKYIARNISKDLTSEDLCLQFHCSRSHLYTIAEKAFGMSIMQYITKVKMNKAMELLEKDNSVAEVAEMVGYNDYNYFCKVFTKAIGISPSKYRKGLRP